MLRRRLYRRIVQTAPSRPAEALFPFVPRPGVSLPTEFIAMTELHHDTWDAPPVPLDGDLDENSTYAGVGRVLSAWEAVEAELSHLYAVFVGKLFERKAYVEYGTGRIFVDRMRTLKTAASGYFVRYPSQMREGHFDKLAEIAEKFASRRNEVAHSIVRGIEFVLSGRNRGPSMSAPWPEASR
jgi:hypothetical protein